MHRDMFKIQDGVAIVEEPLSYTIYLETAFPSKKCNRKHGGL